MSILKNIKRSQNETENVSEYIGMVEDFFYSNDISRNKQQMALFLSTIGEESCKLLHELLALECDSTNMLQTSKSVKPKPTMYEERYKFYARNQQGDESVFEYITALNELSVNCKFQDYFDDALRDKFVCGLKNEDIRKRLLAETTLTLTNAVDMACELEKGLEHKRNCSCCGSKYHSTDECRFRHIRCFHCNKKGHLSKACQQRVVKSPTTSTQNGRVNFSTRIIINEETSHDSTEDDDDFFQRYLVDNGSSRS